MNSNTTLRPVGAAVAAIHSAYDEYARGFEEITSRARRRFEQRDWAGSQADATARLELYKAHVDAAVADVRDILDDAVMERTVWGAMKLEHASRVGRRPDAELAETFFNSVTTKILHRSYFRNDFIFIRPAVSTEYIENAEPAAQPTYRAYYPTAETLAATWRRIVDNFQLAREFEDLDRDVASVMRAVSARTAARSCGEPTSAR